MANFSYSQSQNEDNHNTNNNNKELIIVGEHCKKCKQCDFLPYTCELCGGLFCSNCHTSHGCVFVTDNVLPNCPVCGAVIQMAHGQDPNIAVNQHLERGCSDPPQGTNYQYNCTYPGCKKKEMISVLCSFCSKQFCLKHRLPTDHNCASKNSPKKPSPQAQEQKQQSIAQHASLWSSIRKQASRANPRASRLQTMQIKQKAKGSERIPVEGRFYIEALFPFSLNKPPQAMYFDRTFSIGKVLDSMADMGGVVNNNHKITFSDDRLHLISIKSGKVLHFSDTLAALEEKKELLSGDPLLLESPANIGLVSYCT